MKDKLTQNKEDEDNAENQLRELIRQSGADALKRKQQAMEIHFKKIETVVSEAMAKRF